MLEQEGALVVVVRHLVTEEFKTSIIDQSQSFNGNWYENV